MEPQVQFESEVPPRDGRRRRWVARWAAVRSRGQISYIIRRGILVYGVFYAIIMTVFRFTGLLHEPEPFSVRYALSMFLSYTVVFGLSIGLWSWHSSEKRFRALNEVPPNV